MNLLLIAAAFVSTAAKLQRLLTGPLITDSSTYLALPADLRRGCELSLSLWVWLYRPRACRDEDMYVFSTRKTLPVVEGETIIFPTLIFSMLNRKQFFFSYQLDPTGLHYGAYWGDEVRYHEWTHIAMTLDASELRGYINGELVGSLAAESNLTCSHSNITNTVIHVMGKKFEKSTPGMVEHFLLHDRALSEEEIGELMATFPHSRPPLLRSLLLAYGKHSLQDLCIPRWKGDYFLQHRWGLCPEVVCGEVCIDEAIFFRDLDKPSLKVLLPFLNESRRDGRVFRSIASDYELAPDLPRPTTNRSALVNETLFHGFPRPNLSGKQLIEYQRIEDLYDAAVLWLNGRHSKRQGNSTLKGNDLVTNHP